MTDIFRRNHHDNKGFMLVTTLLVASILLIIAIPYISRVAAEYRLVSKLNSSTVAINVAEAGIERAIWEICYNSSAFNGWQYAGNIGADQTWDITNVQFNDSSGKTIGYYDGHVFLPKNSKTKTITVTAYIPNKTNCDGKKTVIVNYYSEGLFNFSNAIAAYGKDSGGNPLNNSIKIDSNCGEVNSYDSSVGQYGSPAQVATSQGNIVTNGDIQMSAADKHINGNAYYGGKFAGSKKSVTGIVDKLQSPLTITFPDSGLSDAKEKAAEYNKKVQLVNKGTNGDEYSPLDGNNNLSIQNGAIVNLPEGIYYFKSISMGGSGDNKITVEGQVTIYVDGAITTSGIIHVNTVGLNPFPSNLIIYSNYSDSNNNGVSLGNTYNFYGAIYAPYANAELGKGDFYGAVVCRTMHFKDDANIHYDIAIGNATSSTANNRATSWQEQ